ncbi:helicase C-terminal domain-containing protein [Raoultibacter phocaeensis]|uniref:helicase C-terminal domain-containing protein n=1 Tax=Raoultibacter phocaeensis TaxID=2479841 RepID=UPI00111AAE5D|nr:helicase C-terminal domain-containing protein [Raoultibacter phocaeensis]
MENYTAQQTDTLQNYIVEGTPEDIRARYAGLADAAGTTDFGVLDEDVVVLDTETTGFSVNHDELMQIAAARMRHGKIVEWFVTFVNPGKPIPEDVARLTDIHDEDVADAPTPAQALADLVEFVGTSDIVAHNAEFDRNFTTKNMYGTPLADNVWIDSLDLARIALPRLKSHRLIDLVRAFGAPISTHRADADVEALCAVYRILLAAVDAMPIALVGEIAGMATVEEWPTVKVFAHFAQQSEPVPFSLRSMRSSRVNAIERKAKTDADALAADPARELAFPSAETVEQAFSADGIVGSLYPDFETRVEQVMMAEAVRAAFASSTNLAVEAGTGVGKSMAYLVPAALTAKENNIAIGVATKTNALLDQLMYKELPLLDKALRARAAQACTLEGGDGEEGATAAPPQGIDFAALKGFSHYPCLRNINRIVVAGPKTRNVAGRDVPQAPSLAGLLSFIEQSEYDDIDGLKIDYRTMPRYTITTTSTDCLRRKCPFFGTMCFVHGARRRAESADIVVTNHSLLFCDLVADGGLLPPIRYWVVDEAHGAESEARKAFSVNLAADEIMRTAARVAADDVSRNVFIRTERRLGESPDGSTLLFGLTAKARGAGKKFEQAATEFTAHMKDLLYFDPSKRSKGYEFVELWINDQIRASDTFATLCSYARIFTDKAEKLVKACQDLVAYLEDLDEAAELQREIASTAISLKEMMNAAETILFTAPPTYAYAATLSKKSERVAENLQALLIDVGDKMNETLYANTHSVVFASATMTVDGTFKAFEQALGCNRTEFSNTAVSELPSSYNFDDQMTVYVVEDMPEPSAPGYLDALQNLLIGVHRAQQGSMLTLFTNRKEMEKCFDAVQPVLKSDDLRLVCQKWGVSVKGLRDDFLVDEHLSLFALKSFWEGFDAPGATLKGVVIPKLPFSKPTDPLSCERSDRDPHAWSHYVLPAAVLETKQAAGRLIRKSTDSGSLILADKRLITKGYGRAFLNSLPSKSIKVCSAAEVIRCIGEEAACAANEQARGAEDPSAHGDGACGAHETPRNLHQGADSVT